MLIAITGISGSGKDTFGRFLKDKGITKLLSYTTREIRENEVEGEDYYFLTKEQYESLDKANDVFYAGNNYSFSKQDINVLANSNSSVKYSVVNDNGLNYFKEVIPKNKMIHIHLDIDISESIKRMKERGDSKSSIESRVRYYSEFERILSEKMKENADYILTGSLEEYEEFADKLSKEVLGE